MTRIKFCGLKTLDDIQAGNVTLHPVDAPQRCTDYS